MTKKIVLTLIVLSLLSVLLTAEGAINLSSTTGWSKHPVMRVLDNGKLICIWAEGEIEARSDIIYRLLDLNTMQWSEKKVAVRHIFATHFPQIVEDSQGIIHLSYMDGNSRYTRDVWYTAYDYRKPEGEQWSKPELCKTPDRIQDAWQRITIDPQREDLYISWQYVYKDDIHSPAGWHSNIVVVKKTKDPLTGKYGPWSEDLKLSRNVWDASIHQTTVFVHDRLHGVYEEGIEGAWALRYNYCEGGPDFKEGDPTTICEIPGSAPPSYWPELEADSAGNLYLVYSRRTTETKAAFKPVNGNWQDLGAIIKGSKITMIGLFMGRNDVAYCIHNQGYKDPDSAGEKFRPVFVRFTHDNIRPPVLVRETGRYQKVLEIEVENNGTAHCAWAGPGLGADPLNYNIYYERVPQPAGGPRVRLHVPDTLLTNEDITLRGEILSASTPVVNHRFFIKNLKIWGGDGPEYTVRFSQPGFYTIHYYVSDLNNYMGHDAVTVEVLDAPFQPAEASKTSDVVRGYLFRAWLNKLSWKNDNRNDGKFTAISHFNIYRRNAGEANWGSPLTTVPFTDSSVTYEYLDPQAFRNQQDALAVQYAVSVVADVSGFEKESPLTEF
jgi:hypothetical protein